MSVPSSRTTQASSGRSGIAEGRRRVRGSDASSSAAAAVVGESSVGAWYDVHGNVKAALEQAASAPTKPPEASRNSNTINSWNQKYNQALLKYLDKSEGEKEDFVAKDWRTKYLKEANQKGLPPRKQQRNEWIVSFNRSLIIFASGRPKKAAQSLIAILKPMVREQTTLHTDVRDVVVRISLLLLDCILSNSEASGTAGVRELDSEVTSDALVTWLDGQDLDVNDDAQLKFLLTLYKSRLDYADRDPNNAKLLETKIRAVKKELKGAMEIFTQKLKGSATAMANAETASVGSDSVPSTTATPPPMPTAAVGTKEGLLQAHNQAALNLKAHLERLKGNTKKSLVLCGEAQSALIDPTYDGIIHSNNLGLVYASAGKKHLALHSVAKAVRQISSVTNKNCFRLDGTAQRADHKWAVLFNASILASHGRNYVSSYESMATCVQNSPIYYRRPRCWLRMAESCIGLFAEQKRQKDSTGCCPFSTVEENGEPVAIVLHDFEQTDFSVPSNFSEIRLGTEEDVRLVSKQPLLRAESCLEVALKFWEAGVMPADDDGVESARCSMAYLKLEQQDFKKALDLSKQILKSPVKPASEQQTLQDKMRARRRATASMYACEASCALGNPKAALKYLSDQTDNVAPPSQKDIDRMATQLAGVTTEVAANNVHARARLKKAQSMIRTSASVASAQVGGKLGPTAKQMAMSAVSVDDDRSILPTDANRSSARRALLYCMLREGNREGALAVLRSSR